MTGKAERQPAVFVREAKQQLLERFERGLPLFGSDIHVVGKDGQLWYISYRDLPKEKSTSGFVHISDKHPLGDIYAPHSRTTEFRELRVNKIPDVETAIRAMDHIIETETQREKPQIKALTNRAHELLDLFGGEFSSVTRDEFIEARDKTDHLLREVKLDPAKVINEEKKRIAYWVEKGSTGKDTMGRINKLITIMALSAAYRHGIEASGRIGTILVKIVRMREALVFEREFSRTMLSDVADLLAPSRLPASKLFRDIEHPAEQKQVSNILGLLHTMAFQLQQPHAAPYMPAGRESAEIIVEITNLLCDNKRQEIRDRDLFGRAREILYKSLSIT